MKLIVIFVVLASWWFTGGCSVPLGKTSYPHAQMAGVEGTWEIKLPEGAELGITDDKAGGAGGVGGAGEKPARLLMEIKRAGGDERYRITCRIDGREDKDAVHDVSVEGEFIRTRRWTLFTYQARTLDFFGLTTTVQRTMRFRFAGDELAIDIPATELVFVPIPMAGELHFQPPDTSRGGQFLVQNVDDVFATLDGLGEEQWWPVCSAVRVVR